MISVQTLRKIFCFYVGYMISVYLFCIRLLNCFPNSAAKLRIGNSINEETRGMLATQFLIGLSKSLKVMPL